jgi:flagellar motor switch protein FliM
VEKVLNQDEIDAMFRNARGRQAPATSRNGQKVVPCDFRHAGQINSEQVRSISALHEGFARNLTHWLAAYLRTAFECNLVSVEQIPYREALARIPEVAYLATFRMAPMDALGALQLDLSLAFPIIDMLLGGSGGETAPIRDVTEIEEQILEGVVKIICRELQTAWTPLGVEFLFDQRQQPDQMQRVMAPAEITLSLSFEITMKDTRGNLNLVFPAIVSNALLRKLVREWAYQRPHASEQARQAIAKRLMSCTFDVELGLVGVSVRAGQLLSLTPGTLIEMRHSAGRQPSLLVGGRETFEAKPVRRGELRAGQVHKIMKTIETGMDTPA